MGDQRDGIPPGTLDMLILKTLVRAGRMHGFEIAETIRHDTEDVLQVEEGSLYPALQRMLMKGWLTGEWGKTQENRRARYYRITPAGRRHLDAELAAYHRVARAIGRVLLPT
jgi:transcriptional regulator